MTQPRRTRWWRGWLYAALPLVFVLLGIALALLRAAPPSRNGFSAVHVNVSPPKTDLRIPLLFVMGVFVALSGLFFRWGHRARPAPGMALALAGLPWLAGSFFAVYRWHFWAWPNITATGSDGFATIAASLGEALVVQGIPTFGAALMLGALIVVLAIDEPAARPTRFVAGLLVVGLASIGFAAAASFAGVNVFQEIAASGGDVRPSVLEAASLRWTLLHCAQVLCAAATLVGLLLVARKRGRTSVFALAAGLLLLLHGLHLAVEHHLFEIFQRAVIS